MIGEPQPDMTMTKGQLNGLKEFANTRMSDFQVIPDSSLARQTRALDFKFDSKIGTGDSKLDSEIRTLDSKFDSEIKTLDSKFDAKIGARDSKLDSKIRTLDSKFDSEIKTLDSKFDAKIMTLDSEFDSKFDTRLKLRVYQYLNLFLWRGFWTLIVVVSVVSHVHHVSPF
jgi:hypothetical protein